MFVYLILLFTVVPAVELALLIEVGQHIGVSNTIMLIILTGVVGAYLARLQGFLIMRRMQDNLDQGIMPTEEMLDGMMVFCGGVVLLTPGFITDAIGLLLLLPFTRALIKIWARKKINDMIREGQTVTFSSSPNEKKSRDNKDYEDADFR